MKPFRECRAISLFAVFVFTAKFSHGFSISSESVKKSEAIKSWELPDDDDESIDLKHKILAKSVDLSKQGKHKERSSLPRITNKPKASNPGQADSSIEVEDRIIQKMLFTRKDDMQFKIRNSSELHIDNHTNDGQSKSKLAANALKKVVVFQKPFHFHIPIISVQNPTVPPQSKAAHQFGSYQDKTEDTQAAALLTKQKGESGGNVRVHKAPAKNTRKEGQFKSNVNKRDVEAQEEKSDSGDNNAKINDKKGVNLDQLLDQYPELVPPVNRKRSSLKDQTDASDEGHYHLLNNPLVPLAEAPASAKDEDMAAERNVTNVHFSQDVVDTILGHEDDFLTYWNNIKSLAEKLGVNQEEIFRKIVYGEGDISSNETKIPNEAAPDPDFNKRISEFQKLFESDDDEGPEDKDVKSDKEEEDENETSTTTLAPASSPTEGNNDSKILSRRKRGLKNWLKKIFKRGDKPTPTTTTTTSRPKKPNKVVKKQREDDFEENDDSKQVKKAKKGNNVDSQFEFDRNGDSEVDFLLPKALRRSTYLKKEEDIKKRIKEEQEFEEEFEKSEEQEVKTRNFRNPKRRKRDAEDKSPESPDAPQADDVLKLRKIMGLSKDELILIEEMILDIVEFECEDVDRPIVTKALDNLRKMVEAVVQATSISSHPGEVQSEATETLFNQVSSCAEWLSKSEEIRFKNSNAENEEIDRPLRRTKRVRRGELLEVLNTTSNPSEDLLGEDMDKVDDGRFINALKRFMRLHFQFYNLVDGRCPQFVNIELIHDATLILFNEAAQLSRNLKNKEKAELYEVLQTDGVIMDLAEKLFTQCLDNYQIRQIF